MSEELNVNVENVDLNNVFNDEDAPVIDTEAIDELIEEGFTAGEIAAIVFGGIATGVGLYFLIKYVIWPRIKASKEKRKAKKYASSKMKVVEGKFKDVLNEDGESEEE